MRWVFVCVVSSLLGCGGATATAKQDTAASAAAKPTAELAASAATVGTPAAAVPDAGVAAADEAPIAPPPSNLATLPVEPPLAPEINAGVISRATLNAVLALGVGHFLRDVRTEPQMVKGHFAGWRILSLFPDQPTVQVAVLRAGDTVRRAQGQSMERPESFKAIWDSLVTAKEIVLDIERAGRSSKLRYTISD